MSILLTGGTGYIGSHTAVTLSLLGHDVVLLDNLSNSSKLVTAQLARITGKKIPFVKADVRDTAVLSKTMNDYDVSSVIHFAGLKAVGESSQKPIDYYANNVQGTISLLEAMRDSLVNTLVFSSSATVYGEPQYLPLDETHPTNATSPYGRSKLHIEEMLADVATSNLDWRIACLRYFNPVGAHESRLIGENPNGIPNNLMPYIAQVAEGRLSSLNVFGDDYPTPDGTGVRDYIHVMDLAEGHAAALDYLSANAGLHVFNLGTGNGHSVLDMIKAFEKASARLVPHQINARRLGDVAACYAAPEKARVQLNWSAKRTLEEMCASTWNFQESSDE